MLLSTMGETAVPTAPHSAKRIRDDFPIDQVEDEDSADVLSFIPVRLAAVTTARQTYKTQVFTILVPRRTNKTRAPA